MPDLLGVELARPGTWPVKSGQKTFTAQDLQDAADFFAVSGGQAVPVSLGHGDERFSGDPSFGSVTNVRYAEDDRGPVLLGDVVDMPQWLAASAPKRWPNRSIEGWQNFPYEGREYSLVLSGLAFLGVTPPAVRNIKSLSDLQSALAASAAQRVVASAPEQDPAVPPPTPAVEADVPPQKKGAGMNLAKYREALAGLPDDASEEDMAKVHAAFGLVASAPEPAPPQPNPPTPPQPEPAPEPQQEPQVVAASGRQVQGTMTIDRSAWDEREERIKRLEASAAKQRREERDQVIAEAVQKGKFQPARKAFWTAAWDKAPEETRALIDGLTPNVIPVIASGHAGGELDDEEFDAEFAHLFPPTVKGR